MQTYEEHFSMKYVDLVFAVQSQKYDRVLVVYTSDAYLGGGNGGVRITFLLKVRQRNVQIIILQNVSVRFFIVHIDAYTDILPDVTYTQCYVTPYNLFRVQAVLLGYHWSPNIV